MRRFVIPLLTAAFTLTLVTTQVAPAQAASNEECSTVKKQGKTVGTGANAYYDITTTRYCATTSSSSRSGHTEYERYWKNNSGSTETMTCAETVEKTDSESLNVGGSLEVEAEFKPPIVASAKVKVGVSVAKTWTTSVKKGYSSTVRVTVPNKKTGSCEFGWYDYTIKGKVVTTVSKVRVWVQKGSLQPLSSSTKTMSWTFKTPTKPTWETTVK
jgi:hypothetical protein